jgi:hypothetical protein
MIYKKKIKVLALEVQKIRAENMELSEDNNLLRDENNAL